MSFAFFISESYLKENTPIDDNVDPKLLRMSMREAQDIYIRDLIGSGIYDELITQIVNSTLTAANTTLLNEYIAPCMKYYVLYDAAHIINYQIVNKGISTRNSEFQSPAEIGVIEALMTKWKDRGDYYANRLKAYLLQNLSTYPKYTNPGTGIDTIYPKNTQLLGGFYLGNTGTDCPTYDEPR